ncbi:MAG: putative sporulation protein YtxC [Clostridia bacterium]|nr:putative sporulation protein YtxC [Clostridia bacterium]
MKSFCVKNNNKIILDYLLTEIENINLENIYVSQNSFKYYQNIIVHYTGSDEALFIYKLSNILVECIIKFYEKNIVKRIINCDFFYFDATEKNIIYNNCSEILEPRDTEEFTKRREKIFECLIDYISTHKFFILDGFVNFRLFEYNSLISEYVNVAVNKFIIDREYREFIELLRGYINSQRNRTDTIHIIYSNSDPIILDEKQNVLTYDNQFEHPKYLSDISFSSKDYCLNALLNLLPKRLIVHLMVEEDEFVETLGLIFGKRLEICRECNICRTFSLLSVQ